MRLPVPPVLYVLLGPIGLRHVQQSQTQGVPLVLLDPPSVQLQMLRPVQPVLLLA